MVIGTFFNSFTVSEWGTLLVVVIIVVWWATRIHLRLNGCVDQAKEMKDKLDRIDANVNKILGYLSRNEMRPIESTSPVHLTKAYRFRLF